MECGALRRRFFARSNPLDRPFSRVASPVYGRSIAAPQVRTISAILFFALSTFNYRL
jgi:hypothetical protein